MEKITYWDARKRITKLEKIERALRKASHQKGCPTWEAFYGECSCHKDGGLTIIHSIAHEASTLVSEFVELSKRCSLTFKDILGLHGIKASLDSFYFVVLPHQDENMKLFVLLEQACFACSFLCAWARVQFMSIEGE